MYVYTSNESPQDVFFNDVTIMDLPGPVLEETHYYPFGLTMSGISSNALKGSNYPENKVKFNGKELQSREFSDGIGLEWYDYKNRFYDPQIGRFFVTDPLADKFPYYSTYQFAGNEVPNAIDIDGLEPWYTRDGSLATGMSGPYDPTVMNQRGLYTQAQIQQMRNAPPPDPSQPTLRQTIDCPQCKVNAEIDAREKEYQRRLWETQEGQSFGIVRAGVEAAAGEFVGIKAGQAFRALKVQMTGIPQGISAAKFGEASSMLNKELSELGADISIHGSRVSGTATAKSDLDIAVRVSGEQFDDLIKSSFGTPNAGSAKERTMLHAIKTGKIQAGEAGLGNLRKAISKILGTDVDISIIKV